MSGSVETVGEATHAAQDGGRTGGQAGASRNTSKASSGIRKPLLLEWPLALARHVQTIWPFHEKISPEGDWK